jgi:hypothetical protein
MEMIYAHKIGKCGLYSPYTTVVKVLDLVGRHSDNRLGVMAAERRFEEIVCSRTRF